MTTTEPQPTVLVVDDDQHLCEGLSDLLGLAGFNTLTAGDGEIALTILTEQTPDIIVSDIMMPNIDGFAFYQAVRDNPAWGAIPFIFLSARGDEKFIRKGLRTGVDAYLTKPLETEDLIITIESRLNRTAEILHYERLRHLFDGTIQAMGMMVECRDPYTAGHQKRVAELSAAIARALALPEEEIKAIEMASLVHDIGKIAVPVEILSKPGKLDPSEFEVIKTHSLVGFDILKRIDFSQPIAAMVLQHHERMDGSGYPDGLMGDELLSGSRIIAVADVMEAMTAHRPCRPSRGLESALEEIGHGAGRIYDFKVAMTCISLFRDHGFQFSSSTPEPPACHRPLDQRAGV